MDVRITLTHEQVETLMTALLGTMKRVTRLEEEGDLTRLNAEQLRDGYHAVYRELNAALAEAEHPIRKA